MGKSCPKCSSGLEHDFGVFVCAKCGSVLFVDFDGNVQLSTPETASGSSSAEAIPVPENFSAPASVAEPEQAYDFDQDVLNQSQPITEPSEPLAEVIQLPDYAEEPAIELAAEEISETPAEEPLEFIAPINQGPPPAITDVNFDDVVEYANQTELDNTPLVYTLWIEGIDHKEVREKVIEVLRDIKFNLHMKDIIPTIKGGVLELRDLNPVKTSLIATRLREESVKFRWKQSVYQSEAASGT